MEDGVVKSKFLLKVVFYRLTYYTESRCVLLEKRKMKYLLILILAGIFMEANCQKYALVGDTNQFVCKSDSIDFYFEKEYIKTNDIDTLIELHYFYDNGRYEDEMKAIIWKENGTVKIKSIMGCDEITETEIREYPYSDVFQEYFQDSLSTQEHNLDSGWSHEYGYWFSIKQNDFFQKGYIRDSRRGIDNFSSPDEEDKTEQLKKEAEKNPLVKWVNQIDIEILNQLKKE